jgi:hypothetical protein
MDNEVKIGRLGRRIVLRFYIKTAQNPEVPVSNLLSSGRRSLAKCCMGSQLAWGHQSSICLVRPSQGIIQEAKFLACIWAMALT